MGTGNEADGCEQGRSFWTYRRELEIKETEVEVMKRYISVLALDVKNTIWKVLGILVLMSAVQLGYFYLFLQKVLPVRRSR